MEVKPLQAHEVLGEYTISDTRQVRGRYEITAPAVMSMGRHVVGWATTEIGAVTLALGARFVQAVFENDTEKQTETRRQIDWFIKQLQQ
jgi:hypothetical protein